MRTLGGNKIAIETEPGLEIAGELIAPQKSGRKPAVLVVQTGKTLPPVAHQLARQGNIVLAIAPRGLPLTADTRPLIGDGVSFHRAMLIGRNLPGMRALDIVRAFDLLSARDDVDPARISAIANGTAGIWLLMAAAVEPRFAKLWVDGTPASFQRAMEVPLHRNLHDAMLPGLLLRWDIQDIAKAGRRNEDPLDRSHELDRTDRACSGPLYLPHLRGAGRALRESVHAIGSAANCLPAGAYTATPRAGEPSFSLYPRSPRRDRVRCRISVRYHRRPRVRKS